MILIPRRKIIAQVILLCSATFIGITLNASATSQAPHQVEKPPCRVDMTNTHQSTSMAEKFKVLAVKANVVVVCNQPISNLVVFINLYKKSQFGPTLLQRFTSKKILYVDANKSIKISGLIVVCTNWKETEFFSTVSSTAVIAGKPSRAPWRRSFAQKLACGT